MCPRCSSREFTKFGRFPTKNGNVQRYLCRKCRKTFNVENRSIQFNDRKKAVNQLLLLMLCSGVSQRRCALFLQIKRATVARKIAKYGRYLRLRHENWLQTQSFSSTLIFDEMEMFEHTKCKPMSIAIGVEDKTRLILGMHVSSMPAKGKLAKISRKKYGRRRDDRRIGLERLMSDMASANAHANIIKSDQAPRYPRHVKEHFPNAKHLTFKGRRGCVVGQGELKAGGFDPLFSLNHTCAMVRDNLKRASRRTWCTTKKAEQLQNLVNIYVAFHNQMISGSTLPLLLETPATMLGAS
jgi:transposase-like protein